MSLCAVLAAWHNVEEVSKEVTIVQFRSKAQNLGRVLDSSLRLTRSDLILRVASSTRLFIVIFGEAHSQLSVESASY